MYEQKGTSCYLHQQTDRRLKWLKPGCNIRNRITVYGTVFGAAFLHYHISFTDLHICISLDWLQSGMEKTLHWRLLVWSTRTGHNSLMKQTRKSHKTVRSLMIQRFIAAQISRWQYPFSCWGCRDVQRLMWCRSNWVMFSSCWQKLQLCSPLAHSWSWSHPLFSCWNSHINLLGDDAVHSKLKQ